jgi:hypothetical protein
LSTTVHIDVVVVVPVVSPILRPRIQRTKPVAFVLDCAGVIDCSVAVVVLAGADRVLAACCVPAAAVAERVYLLLVAFLLLQCILLFGGPVLLWCLV